MLAHQIPAVQKALAREGLDGWFFSCFQSSDPISHDLLGLAEGQLLSRRCYYLVPREGEARRLVHALEPAMLDGLPGSQREYLTWQSHDAELARLVTGCERVAAQYSPNNALPAISRLDVGTGERLRALGLELVSSAELVQEFAAVWSREQLEGHRRACAHLHEIAHAAFARVGEALSTGREIDEHAVQRFILEQFERRGLWTESHPIVGVNANSADPHYQPGPERTAAIRRGDFLLVDLWAKEKRSGSVYADITWCGVCAASPEDRHAEVFGVAVAARDAGLGLIRSRYPDTPVAGYEVDDATRRVIDEAGYGDRFIHRTGHSIGIQDHGHGANLDNLETHDTRRLAPMTGFSIEPGIYLTGDFGVRTEIDVVLTPDGVEVTGGEPQRELIRVLA
ncbi:MAG: Xaa-Pro peptidase family protein [Thermoanaerobaculia bacterium]|nr:Xaa-Pro peptidase family protein [Thermoanaerobaculia bacterium]